MIAYLSVATAALAAVALLALLAGWRQADAQLKPLATLVVPLLLGGIVFLEHGLAGRLLICSGLVLAAIDVWHRRHPAW